MQKKKERSNSILSLILYVVSALYFAYGLYMIYHSVNYVNSYRAISSISADSAVQYVVTSSAEYLAFAIVIFIGAYIIDNIKRNRLVLQKSVTDSADNASDTDDIGASDTAAAAELQDEHPENNPYYTAASHKEPIPAADSEDISEDISEDERKTENDNIEPEEKNSEPNDDSARKTKPEGIFETESTSEETAEAKSAPEETTETNPTPEKASKTNTTLKTAAKTEQMPNPRLAEDSEAKRKADDTASITISFIKDIFENK